MNRRQIVASLVVAGAVMAHGGVSLASWTANGSGYSQSKASTAQMLVVTATTGAADLYPGFTGGRGYFTLTNPNPYPVTFTSMTAGTVTSSDPLGCPSSNVTAADATGLSLPAAANATSTTESIANVVTMVAGAPDACQGIIFKISLTLTGAQP